jgi:hypothetical protein
MKRKQGEDGELDYEAWCIVKKKINEYRTVLNGWINAANIQLSNDLRARISKMVIKGVGEDQTTYIDDFIGFLGEDLYNRLFSRTSLQGRLCKDAVKRLESEGIIIRNSTNVNRKLSADISLQKDIPEELCNPSTDRQSKTQNSKNKAGKQLGIEK